MRKHVARALITFWKFLSRKIIELHFNLNTTVSINTVNLFIHCIYNHNDYIILNFKILGGGKSSWRGGGGEYCRAPICMKPCIPYQKCTAEK